MKGLTEGNAAKVAVAVAAVLSLSGAFEYFALELGFRHSAEASTAAPQFKRFEALRDELPENALPENAVVGYLTDTEVGATFGSAQYVLAPRILRPGTEYELVIGDFARTVDFVSLGHRYGMRVERDFHNGVVLFRREER